MNTALRSSALVLRDRLSRWLERSRVALGLDARATSRPTPVRETGRPDASARRAPGGGAASGLRRLQLGAAAATEAPEGASAYFQDLAQPNRFYYLPDRFRLARETHAAHPPALRVHVARGEDGAHADAVSRMRLGCVLKSSTAIGRLKAARCALMDQVPEALREIGQTVELRPLPARASLLLDLPLQGLTPVPARVDVERGFLVEFELDAAVVADLPALLTCHDGGAGLTGFVRFECDGLPPETVPVAIRLDDTDGSLLRVEALAVVSAQSLQVRLTNAIESPLRIGALPVWLKRAGRSGLEHLVPAALADAPALAGRILAPGESLVARIDALRPIDGDGPIAPVFDFGHLRADPPDARLWESVRDAALREPAARL